MVNIKNDGSAIRIDFTDNDKYLFDGTIECALNELILLIDESDMVVFKRASNGDVLFSQLIDKITINGNKTTKDSIIDDFGSIGYSAAGGAVSSVNGKTGAVVLTANDVGTYTKEEIDNEVNEINQYIADVDDLANRVNTTKQDKPNTYEFTKSNSTLTIKEGSFTFNQIKIGDYIVIDQNQYSVVSKQGSGGAEGFNLVIENNVLYNGTAGATQFLFIEAESADTEVTTCSLKTDAPTWSVIEGKPSNFADWKATEGPTVILNKPVIPLFNSSYLAIINESTGDLTMTTNIPSDLVVGDHLMLAIYTGTIPDVEYQYSINITLESVKGQGNTLGSQMQTISNYYFSSHNGIKYEVSSDNLKFFKNISASEGSGSTTYEYTGTINDTTGDITLTEDLGIDKLKLGDNIKITAGDIVLSLIVEGTVLNDNITTCRLSSVSSDSVGYECSTGAETSLVFKKYSTFDPKSDEALALGSGSVLNSTNSIAIGTNCKPSTYTAVAIGNNISTGGIYGILIGDAASGKEGAIAIGYNAQCVSYSTAIGTSSDANNYSVAIGNTARTANNSVVIGAKSDSKFTPEGGLSVYKSDTTVIGSDLHLEKENDKLIIGYHQTPVIKYNETDESQMLIDGSMRQVGSKPVLITQSEYDALDKDANTIYFITE